MCIRICYIQWIVFISFALAIIQRENIPEISLISQKLQYESGYNMTCVVSGNSINSAIIWNEAIPWYDNGVKASVSEYIPPRNNFYNCDIDDGSDKCNTYWTGKNGWSRQRSFYSKLGPVTDYRWEEFHIYYTNKYLQMNTIAAISEPNFKIHISIRIKEEAHIYLCDDDEYQNPTNCYLILLGERKDSINSIKKCTNGTLNKTYSQDNCNTVAGEIRHGSGYHDTTLSDVEWRHFTVEKEDNSILLWQVGKNQPTLNYTNAPTESSVIQYLKIKSGETPGFWKLHEYTYTFTNKETTEIFGPVIEARQNNICMSMFVAMCDLCNLIIEVFYSNTEEIIKNVTIKPLKGMVWQETKLTASIPDFPKGIRLRIQSICASEKCDQPFWAIDKFQICSDNEIRVLSLIQDEHEATCQLIKYPYAHISQTQLQPYNFREINCIGNTFSKNCIPCSKVLGNDKPYCDNSIICDMQSNERSICKCATGYTGLQCETSLQKVEQLSVTNVGATSITITWKRTQEITYGKLKHYEIRYKFRRYLACTDSNKETEEKSRITQNTFVNITNLRPYSEYEIEVSAVSVINGIPTTINAYTLQTDSVDKFEMPTVKEVEPTSHSVKITLQQLNCELVKGPIVYYVTSVCSNRWCLQGAEDVIYIDSNSIILTELHAFSNYTVKIQVERRNGSIFNKYRLSVTFQTKVFVPSTIGNITAYSKNLTSISLRFAPPYPPNGNIAWYYIQYCLIYNNIISSKCKFDHFQPTECKLWRHFHCITLKNLESNNQYEIWVYARNVGTSYNNATAIYAKTIEKEPGIVENLSFKWDDYHNLTLTWNHPNITNGVLTKFIVVIKNLENNTCYETSYPVREENYNTTYYYIIPFDTCYSANLNIYVFAFNVYKGPPAIKSVISPPKTPSFNRTLSVATVTNTTITINFPSPKEPISNSFMFITVSNTNLSYNNTDVDTLPKIWNELNMPNNTFLWVAAEHDFSKIIAVPQTFLIGDGTKSNSTCLEKELYNRILNSTTTYIISAIIINEFEGFKRYNISTVKVTTCSGLRFDELKQSSKNGLWALLLLFILLIILGIIFKKRKECKSYWFTIFDMNRNFGNDIDNSDTIPLSNNAENNPGKIAEFKSFLKNQTPIDEDVVIQPSISFTNKRFSNPVKIIDFEKYIKESISNGELQRQHQLLPRGQTKSWDCGLLPQNKAKNRYNNLLAYDYNRVTLTKINNDPHSDYINANYIEGYNARKTYIATQGPKSTTVNDFWRMIWQENVKYIIILANIMEGGKKKTEQYWPNVNEYLQFGKIKVEYVSSRVFEEYERRRFLISYKNVERRVEQLHFTAWPDHGVPLYAHSLVAFIRKILTIPQGNYPIVVHCSAGVGRTGTIILCDLCLRMAAREGVVDVLKHQYHLREQRVNLVDNIEQYKLAHLVLLECLMAPQTNINCDEETEAAISHLLESDKVTQQLLHLNEKAWQDEAMRPHLETSPNPESSIKNRFKDIIPWGYGHIHLSYYPLSDKNSDYINAVEVDGFRFPQRFIVTQQPLPHTKSDFWRMIEEKAVTTIVSLNEIDFEDETSCVFWPTESHSEIQPVPFLTLQVQNNFDTDHYSIITIHMYNKINEENNKRVIVKLFILKGWPAKKMLPNEDESLLKLWEEIERVSGRSNSIVVTCYDGVKACGLFTALSIIIEKIKFEQEIDVCSAVRTVRHNRKQFVTDIEQFSFLYHAAIKYLNCFDLYSNIAPP